MKPKVRAFHNYWTCPRCNTPNSIEGRAERTPAEVADICGECEVRVDVFIPLEQEGPYRADGIMQDQIGGTLEDAEYWNFRCPLCQTQTRNPAPLYTMGKPQTTWDIIVACDGCYKNIRIKGSR